ncbi:MAG: VWA-like domain-containing protein [Nanopusillaceae archaeon]
MYKINNNIVELLELAKIRIAKNHPYFLPLIYSIEIISDENIQFSAGVKAEKNKLEMRINYNKFREDLAGIIKRYGEEYAFYFLILHELMHIVNKHIIYKYDTLKNLAMDLVINDILSNVVNIELESLEEFKKLLGVYSFKEYTWEEIYEMLQELESGGKNKKGNDNGDGGEMISEEIIINEDALIEIEKKLIHGLEMAEKTVGLDSLGQMLKAKLLKSNINWREVLRNLLFDLSYRIKDYSFSKINKKSYAIDVILPGWIKEEEISLNIVIDTSGSISESDLNMFISEVKNLVEQFEINGKVYIHDTKVLYENDIKNIRENFEDLLKNLRGGGGTSHKDVFEKIKKQSGKKINILFTDGYSDLEEVKDLMMYENIFVVAKNYNKEIENYGKVIVVA